MVSWYLATQPLPLPGPFQNPTALTYAWAPWALMVAGARPDRLGAAGTNHHFGGGLQLSLFPSLPLH